MERWVIIGLICCWGVFTVYGVLFLQVDLEHRRLAPVTRATFIPARVYIIEEDPFDIQSYDWSDFRDLVHASGQY